MPYLSPTTKSKLSVVQPPKPELYLPTRYPKLRNDIGNLRVTPTGCWSWVGMKQPEDGKQPREYIYDLLMDELPKNTTLTPNCGTSDCVCPMHQRTVAPVAETSQVFKEWLKIESGFLKAPAKPTEPRPEKKAARPLQPMRPTPAANKTPPVLAQPLAVAVTPPVPEYIAKVPVKLTHPMVLPPEPPTPDHVVEAPKPITKAVVTSMNGVKIACPRGHAWIPENIYVYPNGVRKECGVCKKLRSGNRQPGKGLQQSPTA